MSGSTLLSTIYHSVTLSSGNDLPGFLESYSTESWMLTSPHSCAIQYRSNERTMLCIWCVLKHPSPWSHNQHQAMCAQPALPRLVGLYIHQQKYKGKFTGTEGAGTRLCLWPPLVSFSRKWKVHVQVKVDLPIWTKTSWTHRTSF